MIVPSQRSILYPCWLRVPLGKDLASIVYLLENVQKYEGITEITWNNVQHRAGLPVAVVEIRFKNRTQCDAFAGSLPPSYNIQEPVAYSNAVYIRAQIMSAYEDAMGGMQRLNTILDRYDGQERKLSESQWIHENFEQLAAWRSLLEEVTQKILAFHGGNE